MLGLERGAVRLYAHDPEWEAEAARTIALLHGILGDVASDIQHVGSTSVNTIMAKPIVDIAVAVESFDAVLEKRAQLEKSGFYLRPTELASQLLFACGSLYDGTGELQTHFIHVVPKNSREWTDYLNFRDYLYAMPDIAKQYEALKLRLAMENPNDAGREKYLAGKHDFITYTLRKALVWSYLGKNIHAVMDRPLGYVHKKDSYTLTYPINYGYIPGVLGGDGEELDVYVVGVDTPLNEFDGVVVGIVNRRNDVEDKLIAAPENGKTYTASQLYELVRFQEQYYDTYIETTKRTRED